MSGFYIVGREGIWPAHNNMRAPILIDCSGYPLGYPRSDYKKMEIVQDGGDYFIVYLEGRNDEFEEIFFEIEPLTDYTVEGLLVKVYDIFTAEEDTSEWRIPICGKILDDIGLYPDVFSEIQTLHSGDIAFLQENLFNSEFVLYRPTKQEIIDRNLMP
jgi:hypothetical protein